MGRFNKRLQLVIQQLARGFKDVTEDDVRHVSVYEFWWNSDGLDKGNADNKFLNV